MDGLKRGSAAIVGVAESDLGQVADGFSVIDLMAQGVQRALDDCGLQLKDVDGVFAATTQSRLSVLALSEYLGLNPPFLGSTIVGGSSFEYHVAHAMSATHDGQSDGHGPTFVGLYLQLLVRYLRLDQVQLLLSLQDDGISVFPDALPMFVDA